MQRNKESPVFDSAVPIEVCEKPEELLSLVHQENEKLKQQLADKVKELRLFKSQLFHVDKLAMLGTLGAGVAHELNNPITAISAEADEIIDAIKGGYNSQESTLLSAKNIKHCADRMRVLVDHIRQHIRKDEEAPWQKLEFNKVVADALLILKPQLDNQHIQLRVQLDDANPKLWAHESKLESIIQNLISNAKDAYSAVADDRVRTIQVTSKFDRDGWITIEIADNGCGMPSDVSKKIFEPYFTTKEAGSGTGLGLAIVLDLVKEHHGTLTLESEPDRGTKFTLRFPTERRGKRQTSHAQ